MAGRFEFGQSLLDKTYQEIKGKVQSKLDSSSCSTNVSHGRIENLLVTTDLGAFTLASEDLPDEKRDTAVLSNWVDKKVPEWTHGDSKRVNSLATDTANTTSLSGKTSTKGPIGITSSSSHAIVTAFSFS